MNKEKQDGKSKLQSLANTKDTEDTIQIATNKDVDEDTVSSELNKAFRANEMKLIHKTMDPDLDSIDNTSKKDEPQPNHITINDIASTASSITINTTDRCQPSIPNQLLASPVDTASSISTVSSLESITSSIHSITRDKLESLFEEGMTQQERRERADQYTMQQLRKVMIEKNKLYDSLFPENEEKSEIDIQDTDISQIIIHGEPIHHNQQSDHEGEESSLSVISAPTSQKSHSEFPVRFYNDKEDLTTKPDDDPSRKDTDTPTSNKSRNVSHVIVSETVADRSP
jgi:hypothetical protein